MMKSLLIQIFLVLFADTVASTGGTAYTEAEQQEILDAHNNFRANVDPPASNMAVMEWDNGLAAQAQEWADLCIFGHPNTKEYPDYKGIGQNVFLRGPDKSGTNPPPPAGPTGAWYNEVKNYNISSHTCTPGKQCGHYTQVVWAKSTKVGCGIKWCAEATKSNGKTSTNAWIAVCNYSPAGNYRGVIPYIPGTPCSECSGGKFCKNSLCTDCSPDEDGCECKRECKNCGTIDLQTCQCSCPDGYFGEFCEIYCEDKSAKCGAGFPTKWCNKKAFVDTKCPLMCGHCIPGPAVDSTSCE